MAGGPGQGNGKADQADPRRQSRKPGTGVPLYSGGKG